jgi:hypothetical protein
MMIVQNNKSIFQANSIGGLAVQRLRRSARWMVLGVYRNCFYCQDAAGDIICVGTNQVDRGPFTIKGASLRALLETDISRGEVLEVEDGCMCFSDFRRFIELNGADIWEATFRSCSPVGSGLDGDIELLTNLAYQDAPEDSLGILIPSIFSGFFGELDLAQPLSRLLHNKVVGVMKRIYGHLQNRNHWAKGVDLADHLSALIGIGYGLTPSGDDFCCGVILGMARMNKGQKAEDLAVALCRRAEGKTTPISLAYFKSLAEARLSGTQARLLHTFGISHEKNLRLVLQRTADHGSTSGWDMLAGFAFGVELFRKIDTSTLIERNVEAVC